MPRAKKTEAQSNEEGLPKWAEDEIKSAQFGKPEVIIRTGYILEMYEQDHRLDIQVYEPMPDGRVIVEGISLPKEVKIGDLMKGFVYEFKINFYTSPLSDKVVDLLKSKFNLEMKAIFNFELKELALMDVESDQPASSSAGGDPEADEE